MEVLTRELVNCNIHVETLQTKILRTGLFSASRWVSAITDFAE